MGGGRRVGTAVGCGLGVQVGGGAVGGSEGAGSGVSVGSWLGLGEGGTGVGEADGEGKGVRLGRGVIVGTGVLVGRTNAIWVLVGVGVTAGARGLQRHASSAARGSRSMTIRRPRFLIILLTPALQFDTLTLTGSLSPQQYTGRY